MTEQREHTPAYGKVDLTTCDREPIHIPGAIQPHGVLVAFDASLRAVMVSANIEQALGVTVDDALGLGLADLLGPAAGARITTYIDEWLIREPLLVVLDTRRGDFSGAEMDVVVHRSGERIVLELEPVGRPRSTLLSYQSARTSMARLSAHESVEGLVEQLALEVRSLTDFDRVMVYRFDEHWNGEVIAEAQRGDLNSFLGLRYPATDIPAQARRLYEINWTRLIADVDYVPAPLLPVLDPATGAPLDLTHSTLRSVSPIHLEYLANMGVGASMSISLLVEDQLWGLIACHHYSGPHRPSQDARSAAEFLGQVASAQIAEKARADVRNRALDAQSAVARAMARVSAFPSDGMLDALVADAGLLEIMGASGIVVATADEYVAGGRVPPREVVEHIADLLHDRAAGDLPSMADSLTALDPELARWSSVAAGALLLPGSERDRWMLWLRPEQVEVVQWGGDPRNKEIARAESDQVRLSPRKSFEAWREIVRGQSLPWASWHAGVAVDVRSAVSSLLLQRSRDQVAVAESLQRSVLGERTPQIDGAELAVRYLPASSYQLGGDWWDAVRLDEHRVALVVGDVAGHGVSAVAAMIQVRSALRACLRVGTSVPATLDSLDQLVVEVLGEQIATVLVGVLDTRSRTIGFSSAGHPPPLVFDADGPLDVAIARRPLLGLGRGTTEVTTIDLPAGATVLLYTDGLVERRGIDFLTSLDQLREVAGNGPGESLDAWVDTLAAGIPGDHDDDTTVLALRLT